MAILINMNYGEYTNRNVVANVIRYITRTRCNESRADELVCWGSYNTLIYDVYGNKNPEVAIRQFLDVQHFYEIKHRKGRRIYHETLNLKPSEYRYLVNTGCLNDMLLHCCKYYDSLGFQVVYAVHISKEKGVHIHFVVNAISYIDGHKWQSWYNSDRLRSRYVNAYFPEIEEQVPQTN